ncbi:hypothetical protein AJ80_03881 [Polytolypa hystricis UAMH7299]|uniref:Pyridoxamine 5'-phosphate oxidase Alr4036 family FMN-binding domain-containing protein n=1 Tax=Polytolypa hystricis (strain UAMH7299) TaxID=1447883 RepID=A0A2B7YE47_POLH7|nr:hypothetical protein AJ80_03881 [Polytolypa hystricis UAMH7299]
MAANIYPPPPPLAPWHSQFQSHLSQIPNPKTFSFSTVSQGVNGRPVPRVRTCVFRNFWAEVNLNDSAREELLRSEREGEGKGSNAAAGGGVVVVGEESRGLNPRKFESDLLTFTTDARMDKVRQVSSSNENSVAAAGGCGGPVEALFWFKEVMAQWRFRGTAFIIGANSSEESEMEARGEIGKWMRKREGGSVMFDDGDDGAAKTWTWEREITAQFANMSPIMRGSFKHPPPGTPVSAPVPDPSLGFGQKVTDLYDPLARSHFRVVVIVPEEVEMVDLSNPEEGKRRKWTFVAAKEDDGRKRGEWEVVELWP